MMMNRNIILISIVILLVIGIAGTVHAASNLKTINLPPSSTHSFRNDTASTFQLIANSITTNITYSFIASGTPRPFSDALNSLIEFTTTSDSSKFTWNWTSPAGLSVANLQNNITIKSDSVVTFSNTTKFRVGGNEIDLTGFESMAGYTNYGVHCPTSNYCELIFNLSNVVLNDKYSYDPLVNIYNGSGISTPSITVLDVPYINWINGSSLQSNNYYTHMVYNSSTGSFNNVIQTIWRIDSYSLKVINDTNNNCWIAGSNGQVSNFTCGTTNFIDNKTIAISNPLTDGMLFNGTPVFVGGNGANYVMAYYDKSSGVWRNVTIDTFTATRTRPSIHLIEHNNTLKIVYGSSETMIKIAYFTKNNLTAPDRIITVATLANDQLLNQPFEPTITLGTGKDFVIWFQYNASFGQPVASYANNRSLFYIVNTSDITFAMPKVAKTFYWGEWADTANANPDQRVTACAKVNQTQFWCYTNVKIISSGDYYLSKIRINSTYGVIDDINISGVVATGAARYMNQLDTPKEWNNTVFWAFENNTEEKGNVFVWSETSHVNSAPSFGSVQLNVTNFGGSLVDLILEVNATDSDDDLNSCSFASTVSTFSGNKCILNISDALIQSGLVTTNDTSGSNVTFAINFTLTNNSLASNSSFTSNLTYQRIFLNSTLRNNETVNSTYYYISHFLPTGATLVFGSPFGLILLAASTTAQLLSDFSGDWITGETVGLEQQVQNASLTSNLSIQYVLNQTHLNATNSQSFTFNSVSLLPTCNNVQTANVLTGTSKITTNCTHVAQSGDRLTEVKGLEQQIQNVSETSNLTIQYILNQTHLNVTNDFDIALNNIDLSPVCLNVVTATVNSSATKVTTNCTYLSQSSDYLTETLGTEVQNTNNITEAGNNTYTSIQLNVTSTSPINLTSVALNSRCRSGWTANITTFNAPTSNISNVLIGCNSTNKITKTRYQYNATVGSVVIVGTNVTGFMEIFSNNTDTLVIYNNATVNYSSLLPTGWTNNSDRVYYVNLSSNATIYNNRSIVTTLEPVKERGVIASDCTGLTIYANYCTSQSGADDGSGTITYTYTHRSFLNVSDVGVKNNNIEYAIPIDRFVNWATRTASSEAVTQNGSATNMTLTSNSTHMIVVVGTSHSTSSLPVGENNQFSINWQYQTAPTGGGTPPGGGGGGTQLVFTSTGAPEFTIKPTSAEVLVKQGSKGEWDYVITNTGNLSIKVKLTITRYGTDPSYLWGVLKQDNFALTEKTINLAVGGSETVKVVSTVPMDVANNKYRFNIHALIVDPSTTISKDAIFYTIVGEDILAPVSALSLGVFENILSFFGSSIMLPVPIGGVSSIPIWLIASIGLISFGLIFKFRK